jgi:hypothetical protein
VRPARAAVAAGIAAIIAAAAYFASRLPDLGAVSAGIYATLIVITVTIGGTAMAIAVLTGPEKRATRPQSPPIDPEHPVTGPDHPTAGPDHSTTGPDHPTTDPDHPTTGPDHPTTGPEKPSR